MAVEIGPSVRSLRHVSKSGALLFPGDRSLVRRPHTAILLLCGALTREVSA